MFGLWPESGENQHGNYTVGFPLELPGLFSSSPGAQSAPGEGEGAIPPTDGSLTA